MYFLKPKILLDGPNTEIVAIGYPFGQKNNSLIVTKYRIDRQVGTNI